jgi:gas vesicle protein
LVINFIKVIKGEKTMTPQNNEGAAFFAGLVIGGLVGAALALLLAPQSGEETRAQIRDKSLEYKDMAADGITDVQQKAIDQVTTLQEKSRETYEKGRQSTIDAYEKGRQSVLEAYEKGRQSAAETYTKVTGEQQADADSQA